MSGGYDRADLEELTISTDSTSTDNTVDHLRRAAAAMLWQLGAIRVSTESPFTLASGATSPLYVNGRQVIGDPGAVRLYVAAAAAILESASAGFDVIAGGETAGIPYAAFLAQALDRPLAYLRKKPKGYGMGRRVEGASLEDQRVLLVEDLITDGGSKLSFLDAIEGAGGSIRDCLVFFDRQQGGDALLETRGVRLLSVTDLETTLDAGLALGALSSDQRAIVDAYLRDPDGWQSR